MNGDHERFFVDPEMIGIVIRRMKNIVSGGLKLPIRISPVSAGVSIRSVGKQFFLPTCLKLRMRLVRIKVFRIKQGSLCLNVRHGIKSSFQILKIA